MAWEIVAHSFGLLFRNFWSAVKISLGPILIGVLLGWGVVKASGLSGAMIMVSAMTQRMPANGMIGILGLLLVAVFVWAWIAVVWHRFVLLEEYPRLVPRLPLTRVLAYVGGSLQLALVVIPVLLVMLLLLSLFVFPALSVASQNGPSLGAALVSTVVQVLTSALLAAVIYQFALVLPGRAVGRKMGLGDSLTVMRGQFGTSFKIALIVIGLSFLVQVSLGSLATGLAAQIVLGGAIQWISLMAGVSILTTLYGLHVEGRSLPGR